MSLGVQVCGSQHAHARFLGKCACHIGIGERGTGSISSKTGTFAFPSESPVVANGHEHLSRSLGFTGILQSS